MNRTGNSVTKEVKSSSPKKFPRVLLIFTALLPGATVNGLLLAGAPFTVAEENVYDKPPITCGLEKFTEHVALGFQPRVAGVA